MSDSDRDDLKNGDSVESSTGFHVESTKGFEEADKGSLDQTGFTLVHKTARSMVNVSIHG